MCTLNSVGKQWSSYPTTSKNFFIKCLLLMYSIYTKFICILFIVYSLLFHLDFGILTHSQYWVLLLPELLSLNLLYLNSGPLVIFLLGLVVKLLSLLGIFLLLVLLWKMDVSWFIYALFNFGLSRGCLVFWSKKRKILFFRVAFSKKERTQMCLILKTVWIFDCSLWSGLFLTSDRKPLVFCSTVVAALRSF